MTPDPARFDNLAVVDCAALCGDRVPPTTRVARFGKTGDEIKRALSDAQIAYNARYKIRTFGGLSGALTLVGFIALVPMLLLFFGGSLMKLLNAIGLPIPSFNELENDYPLAGKASAWALFAGIALIHLATRLRARASTVLKHDPRPPVLLLRSFADEARAPMSDDSFGVVTLLEQKLGHAVAGLGPFIAIGMPGEKIAYRGAGRAYYSETEWQTAVLEFMQQSRCIVLVAGVSRALAWELEQVAARNYLGKTVIVLPPGNEAISLARWEVLQRLLPPLVGARADAAESTAAIYHARQETVLVGSSVNMNVSDYGDMLSAPFYELFCLGRR